MVNFLFTISNTFPLSGPFLMVSLPIKYTCFADSKRSLFIICWKINWLQCDKRCNYISIPFYNIARRKKRVQFNLMHKACELIAKN